MATIPVSYPASPAPTIVFMGFFRSIRTYCILWSSAPTSGFAVFPKTKLENPAVCFPRWTDFRLGDQIFPARRPDPPSVALSVAQTGEQTNIHTATVTRR